VAGQAHQDFVKIGGEDWGGRLGGEERTKAGVNFDNGVVCCAVRPSPPGGARIGIRNTRYPPRTSKRHSTAEYLASVLGAVAGCIGSVAARPLGNAVSLASAADDIERLEILAALHLLADRALRLGEGFW